MIDAITALDDRILQALFAVRDPEVVQAFIWISELGSAWTIYGLGAAITLFLVLRHHLAYATGFFISLASSGLAVLLLKGIAERARPPEEFQAYLEVWYSFPSAHAALSAALYGFLAYLAWTLIPNQLVRYIALVFLCGVIMLVSFSRLYLGLHYASDVAAGLIIGSLTAWLGVWWVRFARKL